MGYRLTKEQCATVVNNGATGLFEYCFKSNIHNVVTGSSGGVDSMVTLGIAERACQIAKRNGFELTSVGVIAPCQSKPKDERLGRLAIEAFGAEEIFVPLTDAFLYMTEFSDSLIPKIDVQIKEIMKKSVHKEKFNDNWDHSKLISQGNIKARLRMIVNYYIASMMKGMVLSTDNLSEYWMAFWTICGDVGDFGIIQQLLKGLELYDVARYLNGPEEIIKRAPTDGLSITKSDAEQLGAEYPELDAIMIKLIQKMFFVDGGKDQLLNLPEIGHDSKIVSKLAKRCLNGSFKRKGTVVLSREFLGLPTLNEIEL
jgi:NAD+ synthase